MLLTLLMCSTMFVPLISGSTTAQLSKIDTTSKSLLSKETKADYEVNKTNMTIVSEGGPVVQSTPSMTLPKQNLTVLLSLDKELGKEKSVQPSESKVKPRKGVDYRPENATTVVDVTPIIKLNTSLPLESKSESQPTQHKDVLPPSSLATSNIEKENKTVTNMTTKTLNKTDVIKKPQILSYEALSEMDNKLRQHKQPDIQSSSRSIVQNQMPSPRIENGPSLKVKPTSANRHPGMIMPVVITILVVPMFAVLGYMALRRGQEAWKNRHYKRMDFLLDGMYNE